MIITKIEFGKPRERATANLEYVAESYLGSLLQAGQICGEYFLVWTKGLLNAYVRIAGPQASQSEHHSEQGREELIQLKKAFGCEPAWEILNDKAPRRECKWRDASSLYLFTHAFDYDPPMHHGDNGHPIPSYLFSVPPEIPRDLYFWQGRYRDHDRVWLSSGELEIPAYKELADPYSQLSERGRSICQSVEKATHIPTYYYLIRYWGRDHHEEAKRLCPGCGQRWHHTVEKGEFRYWRFPFCCDRCRLVSGFADSNDDKRHARIGEYRKHDN